MQDSTLAASTAVPFNSRHKILTKSLEFVSYIFILLDRSSSSSSIHVLTHKTCFTHVCTDIYNVNLIIFCASLYYRPRKG